MNSSTLPRAHQTRTLSRFDIQILLVPFFYSRSRPEHRKKTNSSVSPSPIGENAIFSHLSRLRLDGTSCLVRRRLFFFLHYSCLSLSYIMVYPLIRCARWLLLSQLMTPCIMHSRFEAISPTGDASEARITLLLHSHHAMIMPSSIA